MRFLVYFLFVCLLALCRSDDYKSDTDDLARIDSIRDEPECLAAGGTCVLAKDCSGALAKQTGLCPKQADKGVECCYGLSRRETRCQKLGGECFPLNYFCNQKLVLTKATDCPNQKCCILV